MLYYQSMENEIKVKNRLWNKDFSLITLGTINSMIGHCVASFALGLVVYQNTGSTFLYALYNVLVLLPYIIISFFVGPLVDRFSRRDMIIILDYSTAVFYCLVGLLAIFGVLKYYWLILILGLMIGTMNSFYQIVYDSFYPTLITSGNYSKAYSISSMIQPIAATIMVPLAASLYDIVGAEFLFIGSGVFFGLTATFELFIKRDEPALIDENTKKYSLRVLFGDLKEGVSYVWHDKGLLYITIYFFFTMGASAVTTSLLLPFFESAQSVYNKQDYSYLMAIASLGRVVGAMIHYFTTFKKENNYKITIFVYLLSSVIAGSYLFFDLPIMYILVFINGLICVTSYTIRTSSTQSYVPNEKRGRFNSIFYMLSTGVGQIIGMLVGGTLGEFFDARYIILINYAINFLMVILIIILHKKEVIKVYNYGAN